MILICRAWPGRDDRQAGRRGADISGTFRASGGNTGEQRMEGTGGRSDGDLVTRFRQGDREAFAVLYREHFGAVFRFAFYTTRDRMRADELAQDVFVWLVHHAGEFDAARGNLASFLIGVA